MTGTNDKVRSLFLSALMVMSVVAMGTAFTAGAVADTSGNATVESLEVTQNRVLEADDSRSSDIQTQTVEFDAYLESGDTEEITIDTADAEDNGLTIDDVSVDGSTSSDVSVEDVDFDDDQITFDLSEDAGGSTVNDATVALNVDFDVSDGENANRLEHVVTATGDDGSTTLSPVTATYKIAGDYSKTVNGEDSVFAGETIRFTPGAENTQIEVYTTDDEGAPTNNRVANFNTAFDTAINFDTSNLDTGETYNVQISGSGVTDTDYDLAVNDLGLDAEARDTQISTEDRIVADITSNANLDDPWTATLLDSDGEAVEDDNGDAIERTGSFSGSGAATVRFTAPTDSDHYGTGNYSVEVTHDDTGITSETDSIEVSEAGDGDVSFAGDGVFTEEAGDVANVTVEMTNTDEATVTIGTEDQGYYIVYQVSDESGDGQVSLEFNSYTAGRTSQDNVVSVANSDDEIEFLTQGGDFTNTSEAVGSDTLDPTEYEMNASVGHVDMGTDDYTDSDALGSLSLQPRSTDGMQSWVTPKGTDISDLSDDVGNIYDEIGSSITESGEVAYDDGDADGDTVILQLEAGGIEGAIDHANGLKTLIDNNQDNDDDEAIDLTIEQTNEDANRNAKTLDFVNDDAISVIEDPENNSYFIAVELSKVDQPTRDLAEGDNFEATFTIEDDNVLNTIDDNEEVTSDFTLVEPNTELVTNSDDLILIESASGQTISGSTNYAPGTDLNVRVKSSDTASPFQTRPEATVQTDGTFTTEGADFSEVSPGTNLTLQTRRGGSAVGDEYDGRIGEVPTASVSISNQTTDGSTVTVDSVTTENGGFVAIHLNNASGEVIGNSEYLDSGTQQDVEISLDSALDENATVVAMPHQDTNDNEEYDFGDGDGADGPYTENGSAVTDSASITIQTTEDTPTPTDTPEDTPTDTATPDEGEDMTDTPTDDGGDETTTGDGAGFGAVVALVGLLAAALLATRRNN
ncbi:MULTISPECIES: DUF7282 domain-containing protein [Halomicrobium]|uniref:PGF-CTERM sorting domain-containing protein n=2 Tax=Halomicrobium mukohataei TaxID=57705 RepID=C7P4P2_HALMD|nr:MULTISPECIES: BGTF surface domain-containing protein [Halomicrobium]ACV48064.1 conserved hypothetical protein [Halomicrobium mukohataei DSM 12286]QCD66495.1 PGF-CTERM sorting domain-containing protein [Halomicrobium mukohataei]QFR21301.1 PGF-CTERM sorting domain-containing protein [Halomicrobium sp. ZPS1]